MSISSRPKTGAGKRPLQNAFLHLTKRPPPFLRARTALRLGIRTSGSRIYLPFKSFYTGWPDHGTPALNRSPRSIILAIYRHYSIHSNYSWDLSILRPSFSNYSHDFLTAKIILHENYIKHYYNVIMIYCIILLLRSNSLDSHYSFLVGRFIDFFYRSLNYFLPFSDILCRFVENCFRYYLNYRIIYDIICEQNFSQI